ncbi:MAG: lysophospholipid acyltransferase family protein [Chlamydiae bacterium]|nr:lysophospholipid acyltransferase family protein [Chlamydiota bacterium]
MIAFYIFRILTYPIQWLPHRFVHYLGCFLGSVCFYLSPKLRKKTIKHIKLATTLGVDEKQIPKVARKSLENLLITCLEFIKYASRGDPLSKVKLIDESGGNYEGAIFVCSHEANWEMFFWQGSKLMPIVGISKPFKNPYFDTFIHKARQRLGGKLYPPNNGLKECLRALRQKKAVGLLMDHSKPGQGIETEFFGRKIYSNSAHALLSYKTNAPIIPATLSRKNHLYEMRFYPPILPNQDQPLQEEVERIVLETEKIFENSIRSEPSKWLWVYNRFRV